MKYKFEKYEDETIVINMSEYSNTINFKLKKIGDFKQVIDEAFAKMSYIKKCVTELNAENAKPKKSRNT